jgi:4-aminobutyrate aminotransferase-like enzyme
VEPRGEPYGALASEIMRRGLQDGLILLGGGEPGNVLSFTPSFETSDAEIDYLKQKLKGYLALVPGSIA